MARMILIAAGLVLATGIAWAGPYEDSFNQAERFRYHAELQHYQQQQWLRAYEHHIPPPMPVLPPTQITPPLRPHQPPARQPECNPFLNS